MERPSAAAAGCPIGVGEEALAHGGAELGQLVEVARPVDALGDEVLRGVGDEVGEAGVFEQRGAEAAGDGAAGEGERGDAHPQGVAGGGGAGEGEGIEGDVDLVMQLEVGVVGAAAAKL